MNDEAEDSYWQTAFSTKTSLAGSSPLKLSGCERRLSALAVPESHPVSPAASDGGDGRSPLALHDKPGSPSGAQRAPLSDPAPNFSISAYHTSIPSPEERVTLNLFVHDEHPDAAQVQQLEAELAGMRSCVGLLQTQLGSAQQEMQRLEQEAAAAAARQHAEEDAAAERQAAAERLAAAVQQQQRAACAAEVEAEAERVALVIHIKDAAAEPQPHAAAAAVPEVVHLVLNIVESAGQQQQPVDTTSPAASTSQPAAQASVGDPAALQQQLQRVEACREELARQAGQLRGHIAKLEGAVLAGESRVKAQAAELEALKASSSSLEQQLAQAQAQLAVTPERSRAEILKLRERAAEAQLAADLHANRAQRLAGVLEYEAREREELQEFTSLEHQLLTEQERELAAEAAQCRADATAAATRLSEARQRLVDLDSALMQRDDEVKQLRAELEAAQAATTAAAELTSEWRQRAEQYDRDRQAAASNIRKAETELDMVAKENERMFRQLNYVRTRLVGQLSNLDVAVPDIGKLARELQSWCDRESAQRIRPKA